MVTATPIPTNSLDLYLRLWRAPSLCLSPYTALCLIMYLFGCVTSRFNRSSTVSSTPETLVKRREMRQEWGLAPPRERALEKYRKRRRGERALPEPKHSCNTSLGLRNLFFGCPNPHLALTGFLPAFTAPFILFKVEFKDRNNVITEELPSWKYRYLRPGKAWKGLEGWSE